MNSLSQIRWLKFSHSLIPGQYWTDWKTLPLEQIVKLSVLSISRIMKNLQRNIYILNYSYSYRLTFRGKKNIYRSFQKYPNTEHEFQITESLFTIA